MRARLLMTGLFTASLLGSIGYAASAGPAEAGEANEVKIKFSEAPAPVQATLKAEAKGAVIETLDKETDAGKLVYEADVMIDGKNTEIKVGEDGKIVSRRLDAEDEEDEKKPTTQMSELTVEVPAAVKATLTREMGSAKILGVKRSSGEDGDDVVYKFVAHSDNDDYKLVIRENGKLVKKDLDEENDEKAEGKDKHDGEHGEHDGGHGKGWGKGEHAEHGEHGEKSEMKGEHGDKGEHGEHGEKGEGEHQDKD